MIGNHVCIPCNSCGVCKHCGRDMLQTKAPKYRAVTTAKTPYKATICPECNPVYLTMDCSEITA